MQTVETLRDEHNGVLAVLGYLERASAAAERGALVPADVFADIQEFFQIFVDHCHHGKEEAEVFPRLKNGAGAALSNMLEQQHEMGRNLAREYAEAVRGYRPGDKTTARRVADAAEAYSTFLKGHIDLETRELFPEMEEALEAQDGELNEAFERIEVERIGAGTHERLHGMIGGLDARIQPWESGVAP